VISGETARGTTGTIYVEWRENGKRIQKPCGTTPRGALDAWHSQVALISGAIDLDQLNPTPPPVDDLPVQAAADDYLEDVKATKSPATCDAYRSDLDWFKAHLQRTIVGKVTRKDIIRLFGAGRDEGLSQSTINRSVMVGLMALRQAGAHNDLQKGDWPKIAESVVEIYEADEIKAFFAACDPDERLLFQVYLCSGFPGRTEARSAPSGFW
jgi:hypothetical protein